MRLRADYSARQKSAPRSDELDCLSWPTPTAQDSVGSRKDTARAEHWQSNSGTTLTDAIYSWPTPNARDGKGAPRKDRRERTGSAASNPLDRIAEYWPTPLAQDSEAAGSEAKGTVYLTKAAQHWPTPTANQYGSSQNGSNSTRPSAGTPSLDMQTRSLHSRLDPASSSDGHVCSPKCRRLNPHFVEWLMGWPIGWTACDSRVTAFIRWQQQWRLYLFGES